MKSWRFRVVWDFVVNGYVYFIYIFQIASIICCESKQIPATQCPNASFATRSLNLHVHSLQKHRSLWMSIPTTQTTNHQHSILNQRNLLTMEPVLVCLIFGVVNVVDILVIRHFMKVTVEPDHCHWYISSTHLTFFARFLSTHYDLFVTCK